MSGFSDFAKPRLDSVDMLRGLAIIFMVLCHFPIFLSTLEESKPWLYFFANHLVGDFAAPLFLFIAGFSQNLSKSGGSQERSTILPRPIRRGIFIFSLGLLFSVVIHRTIFDWDILTLIGASMVILYLIRNTSPLFQIILALGVMGVTPLLRGYSDWLIYWGNRLVAVPGLHSWFPGVLFDPAGDFKPVLNLRDILNGFFLVGYFPVFPWMSFPLIGHALGQFLVRQKRPFQPIWMSASGCVLMLLGLGVALGSSIGGSDEATQRILQGYFSPLSFYPLTISMFALQLGLSLVLLGVLRSKWDQGSTVMRGRYLSYFKALSRYSLTIYVLHHAVIFWPLHVIHWVKGLSLEGNALSTPMALAAGVAFLMVMSPLLKFWDRYQAKYSLEWILAKLTELTEDRPTAR